MFRTTLIIALLAFSAIGCGNLSPRDNASPRMQQQIDNSNGRIDRIESNQNAIRMAIEKRSENYGIEIFQGDGGLLLLFGMAVLICLTVYYYRQAANSNKIAHILSEQIVLHNAPELEEKVLQAAMYTTVEKDVFHLLTKVKRPAG